MNIHLNLEQEEFIKSQIKQGKYTNVQQVIDRALKLLEKEDQDYEKWLDETRQKVAIGLNQLERGEKVDGENVIAQLENKFARLRQEKLHG